MLCETLPNSNKNEILISQGAEAVSKKGFYSLFCWLTTYVLNNTKLLTFLNKNNLNNLDK